MCFSLTRASFTVKNVPLQRLQPGFSLCDCIVSYYRQARQLQWFSVCNAFEQEMQHPHRCCEGVMHVDVVVQSEPAIAKGSLALKQRFAALVCCSRMLN